LSKLVSLRQSAVFQSMTVYFPDARSGEGCES
jgi:hypothetical protein